MLKFDPKKYLSSENQKEKVQNSQGAIPALKIDDYEKVKEVVLLLESTGIDITGNYGNWIKIGFAFADAFGNMGEELFLSVSSNYPKYDATIARKQYQKCLQSNNSGVSLGTFFHLAKSAGVTPSQTKTKVVALSTSKPKMITPEDEALQIPESPLPGIPAAIYKLLPKFFKQVTKHAITDQEKDVLLLGSLTAISACLPNVCGMYDNSIVYPNLFLFVTAPASSGKGKINLCRKLVYPIHKHKRDSTNAQKEQYQIEIGEYLDIKKNKKEQRPLKPEQPREQLLFIPANSSATGAFELLANNDGKGLIFETEGDTLAQAFKSEHGNYSDGFRKAFHHEPISYYRRSANEYVDIQKPQLSAVLSGTIDQVLSLMPDAENGLFSRFIFFEMQRQKKWRNVFPLDNKQSLDKTFNDLGNKYLQYYQSLEGLGSQIRILLKPQQIELFNAFFSKQYDKFLFLQKTDLEASLLRLGLICYRIILIFTTIRSLENATLSSILYSQDIDIKNAIAIVEKLLVHTQKVYRYLPEKKKLHSKGKSKKESLLDGLPNTFTTQKYKSIALQLQIPEKTAERYINQFLRKEYLKRVGHGQYIHLLKKEEKFI